MQSLVVCLLVVALCCLAVGTIAAGGAGPDPAKWLLHESGFVAVLFLLATLAVSPLRRLVGKPSWVRWRRPFGLAAFVVATLHVVVYATVYQGFDVDAIREDVSKRPYILIGLVAWLWLWPLALTSSQAARRRLGRRWIVLHRGVYFIVPLAIVHQALAQKADLGQSAAFLLLAGCFLIERTPRVRRWFEGRGGGSKKAEKGS